MDFIQGSQDSIQNVTQKLTQLEALILVYLKHSATFDNFTEPKVDNTSVNSHDIQICLWTQRFRQRICVTDGDDTERHFRELILFTKYAATCYLSTNQLYIK